MKQPATIFIIDDDPEICKSLQWLLESVCFNVKTFTCPITFLDYIDSTHSGCIVTDLRMPYMSGLELLKELKFRKNQLPVFVISGHGDIPMAVRAIKMGAENFIAKPFNEQSFIEDLQQCLLKNNSTKSHSADTGNVCISQLTAREGEIMELILMGKLNKQIAYDLKIAISTVELHRSRIMHKMQAKTLPQLIKHYLSQTMNIKT